MVSNPLDGVVDVVLLGVGEAPIPRRQPAQRVSALLLGGQLEQVPHERLVERINGLEDIATGLRSQAEREPPRWLS
ncbi:MAG: hypothetical protein ACRDUS_03405 [Mycobacterium sp.]